MSEEREKDLTLEKMRAKRNTAESLFKKFTEANDFFCTHAFCFYEGEDGKYYDSRVRRYWETNIVSLVAGNKKAVLKVMEKIQADPLYAGVCVMFFVRKQVLLTILVEISGIEPLTS